MQNKQQQYRHHCTRGTQQSKVWVFRRSGMPRAPGDSTKNQGGDIERGKLALSVDAFHIATEEPQAEHVHHDMPDAIGIMDESICHQSPPIPRLQQVAWL